MRRRYKSFSIPLSFLCYSKQRATLVTTQRATLVTSVHEIPLKNNLNYLGNQSELYLWT